MLYNTRIKGSLSYSVMEACDRRSATARSAVLAQWEQIRTCNSGTKVIYIYIYIWARKKEDGGGRKGEQKRKIYIYIYIYMNDSTPCRSSQSKVRPCDTQNRNCRKYDHSSGNAMREREGAALYAYMYVRIYVCMHLCM